MESLTKDPGQTLQSLKHHRCFFFYLRRPVGLSTSQDQGTLRCAEARRKGLLSLQGSDFPTLLYSLGSSVQCCSSQSFLAPLGHSGSSPASSCGASLSCALSGEPVLLKGDQQGAVVPHLTQELDVPGRAQPRKDGATGKPLAFPSQRKTARRRCPRGKC